MSEEGLNPSFVYLGVAPPFLVIFIEGVHIQKYLRPGVFGSVVPLIIVDSWAFVFREPKALIVNCPIIVKVLLEL